MMGQIITGGRYKNAKTIQGVILDAIKKLTREEIVLNGSGRTDSKVHAYGQVANFKTNSNIPPERFAHALNRILPDDIVVKNQKKWIWIFMQGTVHRLRFTGILYTIQNFPLPF